jgi:hypothetical protein
MEFKQNNSGKNSSKFRNGGTKNNRNLYLSFIVYDSVFEELDCNV